MTRMLGGRWYTLCAAVVVVAAVMFAIWSCGEDAPLLVIDPGTDPVVPVPSAPEDGEIFDVTVDDFGAEQGKVTYWGYTYPVVRLGRAWWMAENLQTLKLNDGTPIAGWGVKDSPPPSPTPAYTAHQDGRTAPYGRLYNQYAALARDKKGNFLLCPAGGWRTPSNEDFDALAEDSNVDADANTLKKVSSLWRSSDEEPTNHSGFSVLPAGYRGPAKGEWSFHKVGEQARLWMVEQECTDPAFQALGCAPPVKNCVGDYTTLTYNSDNINHDAGLKSRSAIAVRCVCREPDCGMDAAD